MQSQINIHQKIKINIYFNICIINPFITKKCQTMLVPKLGFVITLAPGSCAQTNITFLHPVEVKGHQGPYTNKGLLVVPLDIYGRMMDK